jgi:hypothetical protein
MLLLGLVTDRAVSMVLDQVATLLGSQLQGASEAGGDSWVDQLNNIDNKLETIPLRSGFTFLRIRNFSEARNEFIKACAANPHGAVARLCLSVLLYREGQQQIGLENFKQAINMNPFVSLPPFITPAHIVRLARKYLSDIDNTEQVRPSPSYWNHKLEKKGLLQQIPPPDDPLTLQHWLPAQDKRAQFITGKISTTGPILAVSTSGGNPVIVWQLIEGLTITQVVTTFDLVTGECLWSLRLQNKGLHMATPEYVILTSGIDHDMYELYAIKTGALVTCMAKRHYEVVFCPNSSEIQQMDEYKRSNHTMTEEDCFLGRGRLNYKAQAVKVSSLQQLTDAQQTYTQTYVDEHTLYDPFKLSRCGIKVTNIWEYKNTPSGYRGFSIRTDKISCRARISNILGSG